MGTKFVLTEVNPFRFKLEEANPFTFVVEEVNPFKFVLTEIPSVDSPNGSCSGLTLVADSTTTATATWTNGSTDETAIVPEISTDQVTWTAYTLAAGQVTYQFIGLESSTLYYARVRAKKNAYYSDYSNIASATTQSAFEAETTALVARFDVAPSAALKTLINTTIKGLKDDGCFTKINTSWVFGLHTAIASLQNWRRNDNNGTLFNNPTFTPKVGFTGDGATSYIALDFIPSVDAVEMQLGNESILFMIPTLGTTDSRTPFGVQKTAAPISVFNLTMRTATFDSMYINSDGSVNNNLNIAAGEYIAYVRNGTSVQGYKNGVASGLADTVAQAALVPYQMTALCNSPNNTRANHYNGTLALLVIGGGWTPTDVANITARFQYLYNNIGSTF